MYTQIVQITEKKEQQTWMKEVEDTNKNHRRKK
jgi:hypothetical protein